MKILITGMAGFIGMHLAQKLCLKGHEVVGFDNLNSITYEASLKLDRLKALGFTGNLEDGAKHQIGKLTFLKLDLQDKEALTHLLKTSNFDAVVNLAALAEVRLSTKRPYDYYQNNVTGFVNLLEAIRALEKKPLLLFASSSSVYGDCTKAPFSESNTNIHPVSVYAATKRMNEEIAYTYSLRFNLEAVGLRFFTVYGPWGRPDMAPFIFTRALLKEEALNIFNHGKLKRDFTYVEDIVEGLIKILDKRLEKPQPASFEVYNIGHGDPVELMDFIGALEEVSGKKALLNFMPMQEGDVHLTYADITKLKQDFGYEATTPLKQGIHSFYKWYQEYYHI